MTRTTTTWLRETFPTSTTVTDVMLADDSPAHLWPETRNPANQWLANHKGRRAAALEVVAAGECARAYVWAAMHPDATREKVLQEARRASSAGRRDVSAALRRGYDDHHPVRCERVCEYGVDIGLERYAGLKDADPGCGNCEHYL